MANLIDGKKLAQTLYDVCAADIKKFTTQFGRPPKLSVIIVGENTASQTYVASKKKKAEALGMVSEIIAFAADITENVLHAQIRKLNSDDGVNGILLQLPLPDHLDAHAMITAIDPKKDVDGLTPYNAGRLALGRRALTPCTPSGCVLLAKTILPDLTGQHAIVIGRSVLVGRPLAALLLQENCTVSIAHSKTEKLPELCQTADILFAAAGKKHLIRRDWVSESAIIIDVGIHREMIDGKNRLTGDVAFDEVADKVRAITPVPGGVGPMTVACLMKNTLRAAYWQKTGSL